MFEYQAIEDAFVEAVRDMTEGREVAVACSGGLDSGLVAAIAKRYASSVTVCVCGTKNAHDVSVARDLANRLDLPFAHAQIAKGTAVAYVKELITAAGTPDPFTISYELPLFSVCKTVGESIVLSGQGSDEYFDGCAKVVGRSDEDYSVLREAGIRRLIDVSIPAEVRIAEHFGKTMGYPFMAPAVVEEVEKLDPLEYKPDDMESRKHVLKQIAIHLGYRFLAERTKKASQYGSGATDLLRGLAKERGMMFAEFIASISDEVITGRNMYNRGAVINARIDPIVKEKAERVLLGQGLTPSDVVESVYRKIIEEGGFAPR